MNNYDQSSSGENIKFTAHYSCDLASIYFDDFSKYEAKRLDYGRDGVAFLLGDYDKPYYTKAELLKLKKAEIVELCQNFGYLSGYDDGREYNKAELISDLFNVSCLDFYQWLFNEDGFFCGENIKHDYFISRGYSQGDAVHIIDLNNTIDKNKRDYINRILWDSPISIYCTVNDQEFFECDFLADQYEWDRDAVANEVKSLPISESAKAWIIDALPEYPEYQ